MSYDTTILAEPSLVAYWKLDDTTTTAIDSKNGYNGVYSGLYLQHQPGPLISGFSTWFLQGAVVIPSNAALNFDTNDVTIEAWFATKSSGIQALLSKYIPNVGLALLISNGQMWAWMGVNWSRLGPSVYHDGFWHHVIVTRAGKSVSIYVDGILVGTSSRSDTVTTTAELSIGQGNPSWTANYAFNGNLSNIALYNTALSLATIQAHFNAFPSTRPLRVTQEAIEALVSSTPSARITQDAVEVLALPVRSARTTQEALEVLAVPDRSARVTQDVVEALAVPTSQAARVTQEAIEVLTVPIPSTRVTQETLEALVVPTNSSRITQDVLEVLASPLRQSRITQIVIEVLYHL